MQPIGSIQRLPAMWRSFSRNWQYGFGSATGGIVPDIDPDGDATLRKFDGIGQPIGVHYIVNNLPYAQALEDGHSWHQAPYGIVGLAMAESAVSWTQ